MLDKLKRLNKSSPERIQTLKCRATSNLNFDESSGTVESDKYSSNPRVLIVLADRPGGIRSMFIQIESFKKPFKNTYVKYFCSYENRKHAILRFPIRAIIFTYTIIREKYDLVHFNLAARGSTVRKLILSWICRIFRVPYLIHLRGSIYREFFDNLPAPAKSIVKNFFRKARRVVVLGTVWRDYVVQTIGVNPERVTIVPNAVYGPDELLPRVASSVPHILFLGQLGDRKGVPDLLRAFTSAEMQSLTWRATLAGDGDTEGYRKRTEQFGIGDRVVFPGWLSRGGVQDLLVSADVLVLPSHAENLPLSMLEGMAYGLCPVVTPVGAVCDVIHNGENGLIVPVGDESTLSAALAELVREPDLRHRIGLRARATFEANHNLRNYPEKMEKVYWNAVSNA